MNIAKIILYFFLISFTISSIFVKSEENEIKQQRCKIALLLSGDFNDLGYNYQMNNARSKAESNLTLEFSLFYKNLETSAGKAEEAIIDAVEKGANLIIVSSGIHTQLGYKYAEIHKDKDIYWLIRGRGRPAANLPKVTVVTFNAFVLHYALGYFSGLQSKTGVVGFVAPGPNILSSSNANSFYLGALAARPNISFVNVETGSWLNSEVSYKAAQLLISNGADFIGMSQDDMSVQQAVMDSGNLGLGATGYSSKLIYGSDIALSYITDWSDMFIMYAGHVLNGTFPVNGTYFTTLSNGGSLEFDTYSFKVDNSTKNKTNDEIDLLKDDNYQPFRCSPMYLDIGIPVDSFYCIDDTIFKANKLYLKGNSISKFTNFGTYTIPIEFVDYSTSLKYGISISSGICIFLCFVSMFLVLLFRKAKIIKSASPVFCLLILFGCIIIFCGCIIFAQSPTDATCSTRVWLLSIGYTIFLGNLLVKNWRIWLLFDNPQLKKRTLTNWKLYPWVMGILAVDVLILSLWHGLGDIHSEARIGIDSLSKYEYRNVCSSGEQGTTALYILIVFHGLMLIIACFISFKIKVVDIDEFNESKPISTSVYIITFCLFIVIPLMVSDLTVEGQTTIICVCAIVTTIVSIGLLFGSKFYKMLTNGLALNQSFATSTKSSSLSMSNGGVGNTKRRGGNGGIEDEDSEESDIVFGVKDENNANLKHNQDRLANFSSDENTSARISRQQSHMAHFSSDTEDEDNNVTTNNNDNEDEQQQQQSTIQSKRLSNQLNGESEINQNNI